MDHNDQVHWDAANHLRGKFNWHNLLPQSICFTLNANFRSKLNNPHVGSGVRWRICCENIKIFCMKVLSFAMFANLCNNAAVCFACKYLKHCSCWESQMSNFHSLQPSSSRRRINLQKKDPWKVKPITWNARTVQRAWAQIQSKL